MPDVIIIGGGAAGLMAAAAASAAGADVLLLERNEKLGKKIYITGKGRCNVTNDCTMDEFMREVCRNPRFLYSALTQFSPQDMIALLERHGCPVEVQHGRRAYPASMKASDVTRTLQGILERRGVRIRLNTRAEELLIHDGSVRGVRLTDGSEFAAAAVILATGGRSYPATGSTGDGYRLATRAGHRITPLRPSLSALETEDTWPMRLQGLSLRNVAVTLKQGRKTLYHELGEMLFTHFGISGPLVLEMSCHLPEAPGECSVSLDLKPGLSHEQLDVRLQRELAEHPRRQLSTVLPSLLPARMAALFPDIIRIPGDQVCSQISRETREAIGAALKAVPIRLRGFRPLEEAIVTRGGVDVKEIDPSTMCSRLCAGLYMAGELLDLDAHTGGYNLQIAFSTGFLAGRSAAASAGYKGDIIL